MLRSKVNAIVLLSLCLLLVTGIGVVANAAAASNSAVGVWKLDAQKSSYGNMPAPKFEQLTVTKDEPGALKWNMKGVTAQGKTYFSSYDGPIDGKDHPMLSNEEGSGIAYTRMSASSVQWTMKNKSGAVIETATGMLSPDGNTLTIKGTTQGPSGKVNFISVFQRTQ